MLPYLNPYNEVESVKPVKFFQQSNVVNDVDSSLRFWKSCYLTRMRNLTHLPKAVFGRLARARMSDLMEVCIPPL